MIQATWPFLQIRGLNFIVLDYLGRSTNDRAIPVNLLSSVASRVLIWRTKCDFSVLIAILASELGTTKYLLLEQEVFSP